MNAEFNWWLLIVGLVVGAGLVWYVLMDSRRREADLDATERPREAAWLSVTLEREGWVVPPEAAERLLELHRAYLEAPPPDDVPESVADPDARPAGPISAMADTAADGPTSEAPDGPTDASTVPPVDGSELSGDDRVDLRA